MQVQFPLVALQVPPFKQGSAAEHPFRHAIAAVAPRRHSPVPVASSQHGNAFEPQSTAHFDGPTPPGVSHSSELLQIRVGLVIGDFHLSASGQSKFPGDVHALGAVELVKYITAKTIATTTAIMMPNQDMLRVLYAACLDK